MDEFRPYTQRDFVYAVNCSAITAWGIVESAIYAGIGFSELPWDSLYGLPIAFISVWLFGSPFIRNAMRENITFARAALLGLAITSICAFVYTITNRAIDLIYARNRWEAVIGDPSGIRLTIDGYLTPAGAFQVIEDVGIYLCAGVIIGMIVRIIIGPGEEREQARSLGLQDV